MLRSESFVTIKILCVELYFRVKGCNAKLHLAYRRTKWFIEPAALKLC